MRASIVFDAESTGIEVFNDRIVQFVISGVENGEVVWTREWIVNPGVPVPQEAAEVHGFTTEYLEENGVESKVALEEIREMFADNRELPWIAYNLNFDLSLLDAEFRRHGVTDTFGTWARDNATLFDPLVVDRAKDKYRKGKRKLENVAAHYGVPFDPEQAHKADYDVEITAKVASKVAEKFGIPSNEEQSQWYYEWADHLEEYLRRTDPDATVSRDWPLRLKEGA